MALYEVLAIDFSFSDERGSLSQLIHEGISQVNVLKSRKGVERGGHYHKASREYFYVISGKVEVTMRKNGNMDRCLFSSGDFFGIRPYVIHSMYFPEDCVMVAMYDIPIEKKDGSKDIYEAEAKE